MAENKTSLIIIGTSVDEAVAQGAEELGLSPEVLDVEVLDEGSKGLFGLGKREVRVRLTVRTSPAEPTDQPRTPPTPPQEGDDEAVRATYETVTELLQRMGIRATVDAEWGEVDERGRIRPLLVDIRGDDLSILIGRRGETLSALQYITRLIIGKELKRPVSVIIDVEGYRSRREQQLRRLARRMAQQAIETGRTTSLEPMPANERRIIHIELRNDPNVNTLSVGEGDRRKVTIVPVD